MLSRTHALWLHFVNWIRKNVLVVLFSANSSELKIELNISISEDTQMHGDSLKAQT